MRVRETVVAYNAVPHNITILFATTMPKTSKKAKSKARLDKYYYLAKEHGYRSRAAFKLIQLNQKYDFLSKAVCLVDLCAAPGGWMQVASKYMPLSSVRVGIDLVPIRNVPGCVSIQADITTPKCLAMVKREIKHMKADVVLHDGAPNVGAQWNKDAYTQADLVLSAMKLATQLLRSGGTFVTKIFRSKDYASLLVVFKKLFRRVIATKPKASRATSAEIFVVCLGYLAPSVVEPQLVDPKVVFNDSAPEKGDIVTSLKQMLLEKRHRSGYNEGEKGFVYAKTTLAGFVKAVNPFQMMKETTELLVDDEARLMFRKVPPPADIELLCKDIKVLGKKDLSTLLKWRTRVLHSMAIEKTKKDEEAAGDVGEKKEEKKQLSPEEEIESFIKLRDKKQLKAKKRLGEKLEKQKKRDHHGEFAGEDNVDEDLGFDEVLENPEDLEDVGYISLSDTDDEIERQGFSLRRPGEEEGAEEIKEEGKEGEEKMADEGDDEARFEKMNEDLEDRYKLEIEERTLKRRIKRREKRGKNGEEDMSSDLGEDSGKEDKDSEEEGGKPEEKKEAGFVNPIKGKINEIVEDQEGPPDEDAGRKRHKRAAPESSKPKDDEDDENEPQGVKKEKSDRDKRKDKRRMQRERLEDEGKIGKKTGFEEVPQQFNDNMDLDEIAETVAIAKLMLRKKKREELIDNSYNRYVFEDDDAALPSWFRDEEERHNKPQPPVTREMIDAEKERMRGFTDKTSKKVLEARARKKMKIARKLDKLKRKAQVIVNQEDISEASKFRQIDKMYKKEKATKKEDKKYVVSKRVQATDKRVNKHGKNVKLVDRRMKKDTRALQRLRGKKGGRGGKGGHGKRRQKG